MQKISEGLWAYMEAHETQFPPTAITRKDGKPLLSWRVLLLLPYLGEDELYREFKLDEPWDSPSNLALLDKMPQVYDNPRFPSSDGSKGMTYYQAVDGPKSVLGSNTSLKKLQDENGDRSGVWKKILIAEAGSAIPWTKPEDIQYAPDKVFPNFGGPQRSKYFAVVLHNFHKLQVGRYPQDLEENTLRTFLDVDFYSYDPW